MTTLFEVLRQADARRIAVGHFNVADLVTLYGVVEAARQHGLPVVRRYRQRLPDSRQRAVHAARAGDRGCEAGRGSTIGTVQRRSVRALDLDAPEGYVGRACPG